MRRVPARSIMAANQPPPAQSNWFTEWSARTPVVTRFALFILIPIGLVGIFVPVIPAALVLTPSAILAFQIWRFITMFLIQLGILTLFFVLFFLVLQGPAAELRVGSLAFLWQLFSQGLLINITWATIVTPLTVMAPSSQAILGEPVSSGCVVCSVLLHSFCSKCAPPLPLFRLWPIFMALISIQALADPSGSANMRCFAIPNRY
jgi:membrane associated rhomboid family serine protease